jgi:hypothetical protein
VTDDEAEEKTRPIEDQKADVEAGEQKLRVQIAGLLQLFQRDKGAASKLGEPATRALDELCDDLQTQIAQKLHQLYESKEANKKLETKLSELEKNRMEMVRLAHNSAGERQEAEAKITVLQGKIQTQVSEVETLRHKNRDLEERMKQAIAAQTEAERDRQSIRDAGARLAAETRDEFLKAVMTPIYEAVVSAATEAAGRFALVRLAVQESEARSETEIELISRDFLKPLLAGADSDRFRGFLEAGTGTVEGADRLLRRIVSRLRPFPASVQHGLVDERIAQEVQLDAADVRASVDLLLGARVTIPKAFEDCFDVAGSEASEVYQIAQPGWMVGRAVLLPAKLKAVTP